MACCLHAVEGVRKFVVVAVNAVNDSAVSALMTLSYASMSFHNISPHFSFVLTSAFVEHQEFVTKIKVKLTN